MIPMDPLILRWLKGNRNKWFESPRKVAFKRRREPDDFMIIYVDESDRKVGIQFKKSKYPARARLSINASYLFENNRGTFFRGITFIDQNRTRARGGTRTDFTDKTPAFTSPECKKALKNFSLLVLSGLCP